MNAQKLLGPALSFLVGLLSLAVPVYVSYDLYERGQTPEKRVELRKHRLIDPMSDLATLGDRVTLSLRVENEAINNLVIQKAWLRNVGRTPIVPTDYHEKISIVRPQPWKIIAVENSSDFPNSVEFKWQRKSDNIFEAEPALLNPNDVVSTHVYATNTKYDVISGPRWNQQVNIEWKARITNLLAIVEPPDLFSFSLNPSVVMIHLSDWSLFFTIIAAMVFEALYLVLLSQCGFLRAMTFPVILLVLGVSLLSFAAAESLATYIFGNILTRIHGVQGLHWVNAPWIVLHVIVLSVLSIKAWNSDARQTRRPRLSNAN